MNISRSIWALSSSVNKSSGDFALNERNRSAISRSGCSNTCFHEPSGQRRVAALHDGADSQPCLTSAFAACQHAWAGRNPERLANSSAMWTGETVSPAQLFEVFSAGGIIREEPLKLRQRSRKRQRGVQVDVPFGQPSAHSLPHPPFQTTVRTASPFAWLSSSSGVPRNWQRTGATTHFASRDARCLAHMSRTRPWRCASRQAC